MNQRVSYSAFYSFGAGILTGASTIMIINAFYYSFQLDTEQAANAAFKDIIKNSDLTDILGRNIRMAEVKTYSFTRGFSISRFLSRAVVQLLFHIKGSKSSATAFVVCSKKGIFGQQFEYIGVDWVNNAGTTLTFTLSGTSNKFTAKKDIVNHLNILSTKSSLRK